MAKIFFGLNPEMECTSTFNLARGLWTTLTDMPDHAERKSAEKNHPEGVILSKCTVGAPSSASLTPVIVGCGGGGLTGCRRLSWGKSWRSRPFGGEVTWHMQKQAVLAFKSQNFLSARTVPVPLVHTHTHTHTALQHSGK